MVNKPASVPVPSTSTSIDALKRKFQRVNQEIVKQNVVLQEQAARIRQENHRLTQDNLKFKGRIVALESKLREAESVCTDTKRSIAGRIEILEAIGEHLISVTKFLRVLSCEQETEDDTVGAIQARTDTTPGDSLGCSKRRAGKSGKLAMDSIAEEQDLTEITCEIGDVSLKESGDETGDTKRKRN